MATRVKVLSRGQASRNRHWAGVNARAQVAAILFFLCASVGEFVGWKTASDLTQREAKRYPKSQWEELADPFESTGDRHVRHGWVGTVHGSQGATADRSMTHLESFRTNTVDAKTAYVAISRARSHAAIYTDSKEGLANAIETRTGERQAAIATSRAAEAGSSTKPAPSRRMGLG